MTDKIVELQNTIENLRRENELKTGWISLISHNFKENFYSLLWIIEALENETISKEVFFEMLPQIKHDTTKNLQTVSDTAEWLQTQFQGFSPKHSRELVYEMYSNLKRENEKNLKIKEIDFQFHGDENLFIQSDLFLLGFIFNKLLQNAIKYSHPKNEVHFTTFEKENCVLLSIVDFGIGMGRGDLDSIFSFPSPVFEGTNGEVGAGLSLKIVNNFVSLLGGSILINSSENKGTTVTVSLPK